VNLLKRRTERNDGDLVAATAEFFASEELGLAIHTVMALKNRCLDEGMSRKEAEAFVIRMLLTVAEE
jgi:hypothetical protein